MKEQVLKLIDELIEIAIKGIDIDDGDEEENIYCDGMADGLKKLRTKVCQLKPLVSLPSRTFGEWIDVKEKPKEWGKFLLKIKVDKGTEDLGYIIDIGYWNEQRDAFTYDYIGVAVIQNIVAWMPLPPL